jgi:CDP-diacylglycerol--glycerol-3-phosphate 3-phosphatidyltransferase/cardiolipin synthase
MFFNLPTSLTWIRILAIPLVIIPFTLSPDGWTLEQAGLTSAIIFIVASLTDAVDGFLARKMKQTTAFGAFLDPVADKLLVSAAILILLSLKRIDVWVALIIIGREISVSALREWMARIGSAKKIAVHWIGKVKTVSQMVAIPFLLFQHTLFGEWLILLAALLTLLSMLYYCWSVYLVVQANRDSKSYQPKYYRSFDRRRQRGTSESSENSQERSRGRRGGFYGNRNRRFSGSKEGIRSNGQGQSSS